MARKESTRHQAGYLICKKIQDEALKNEPTDRSYSKRPNTKLENKGEYCGCLELIFTFLRANERPSKPALIECFAYAANIKISKGKHVYNQTGRELKGFSYSAIARHIDDKFSSKVSKQSNKELAEELMTISKRDEFNSLKTAKPKS